MRKPLIYIKLQSMKQLPKAICLILFCLLASPLSAQQNEFISDYLERLEQSRKYLLLVAETMPEEQYGFRATPESMSFAENFLHIGYALDWHSQSLLGGRESREWKTDLVYKVGEKSKAEMIAVVDETFDAAIALIQQFDPVQLTDHLDYFGLDRSKRQIFLLLSDHITHHRGQMLVSMRLNGLTPPRYVLFQ